MIVEQAAELEDKVQRDRQREDVAQREQRAKEDQRRHERQQHMLALLQSQ